MKKKLILKGGAAAVLVATSLIATASDTTNTSTQQDKPYNDPVIYSLLPDASLTDPVKSTSAVVFRQLEMPDQTINYTATTGHIVTTSDKAATIFYTAYKVEQKNGRQRPVTFFYGGGSNGPATDYHMNGWGPMRLMSYTGTVDKPNHIVSPSPDSLLEKSDLVFIDTPGKGYSQAISPSKNIEFSKAEQDANVLRDFILQYLEDNNQKTSSLYLYSGSEGGVRSAILANKLNDAGVSLNGVIVHSPQINKYDFSCEYNADDFNAQRPLSHSCAERIPTIAATSYYYGIAGKGKEFKDFMKEVMSFVHETYIPQEKEAFADKTFKLPEATVNKLSKITGFSEETLGDFPYYFSLDSSYTKNAYIETMSLDCDQENANCPYTPVDMRRVKDSPRNKQPKSSEFRSIAEDFFDDYLRYTSRVHYDCRQGAEICEKTELPSYSVLNRKDISVSDNMIPVWKSALRDNTKLKILSIGGFYDHVVPFDATLRSFNELALFKERIKSVVLESGHNLVDETEPMRRQARNVITQFYDWGTKQENWINDGHFLQYTVLKGLQTRTVTGDFGGWAADKAVSLVSSALAVKPATSQAIDLNHGTGETAGVPGRIYQDITLPASSIEKEWVLRFDAGNNYGTWCSSARPDFTGDQKINARVTVLKDGSEETIGENTFNLGPSKASTSGGWANPEWRTMSVPFSLPAASYETKLRVIFSSISEEGKACGGMVSQVELKPAINS